MYRVSDTVRSTQSQDGAVLLDIRQGQMFNLNFVGSRILELLKSGFTESEIVTKVSHEFDVSEKVVKDDVRGFIESLKTHRLISDAAPNLAD